MVPRAKQQNRADFTHNAHQLREIGRENSILVEKIAKISVRGKDGTIAPKQEVVLPDRLKVT